MADRGLPGLRSTVERGEDGFPFQVILEERAGQGRCVIGHRERGKMEPVPGVLDTRGVELVRQVLETTGEWAVVDEIGFLEQSGPDYQQALWRLFEEKRMLAVLRKEDLPFLNSLRGREDCFVLDLDARYDAATDSLTVLIPVTHQTTGADAISYAQDVLKVIGESTATQNFYYEAPDPEGGQDDTYYGSFFDEHDVCVQVFYYDDEGDESAYLMNDTMKAGEQRALVALVD